VNCALSCLSAPQIQRKFNFVLNPCFLGYLLCSDSVLRLLVPPRDYFFAIICHTESFLSAHLISWWSYSCFEEPPLHLRVHCAFRKFSEQARYAVCKGLSYILVHQGFLLYFGSTSYTCTFLLAIGVARGAKGTMPPTFLENIVILCFERRFSKQNSVIRLKSYIFPPNFFAPSPNFWAPLVLALSFFQDASWRPADGDRSTVLHPFWHERSKLNGTSHLRLWINQRETIDPRNLCTMCAYAYLCVGKKCSWCTVHCYNTVAAGVFR